jgi:phosphate transport system ATP-binding protein
VTEPDATPRYEGLSGSEVVQASFLECAVVQLITGDPASGHATVVAVHPADVVVTSERLVAVDGELEWSWLLTEVEALHHGATETWTVLEVPGVADHGVSVRDGDAVAFRALLDRAVGGDPDPDVDLTPLHDPRPRVEGDSGSVPGPVEPPVATVVDSPAADPEAARQALVSAASVDHHAPVPDPALVNPLPPPPPPWPPHPVATASAADAAEPIVTTEDVDPDITQVHLLSPPPGMTSPADVAVGTAESRPGVLARVRRRRPRAPSTSAMEQLPLAGLESREISAWFGTHHVLDRVSLDMAPGKVTALIGPSGCGKSTFLRILNRMHEMIPIASLSGEVLLDGEDIYDPQRKLTDARRQIGMVFQKPNPFPAMSIYDNVVASYRLTGSRISGSERDEVVEACLSKAGLWTEVRDRLRAPGGGLSGGQQQRLCIARALAIRPRVLLMDEPCSALDPTSTRRIEQTIMELGSEVTIVIVTHNMQQAARVSDQCAFFLAEQGTPGVIVEHGPTDAMFERPQDPRTHDYVNGRFG